MTKTLFIPAKKKLKANEKKILELSKQLPENIAIAYSIQYQDLSLEIKKILQKKHNITNTIQVLGCSKPEFPKPTQAILLIGSGKFHATNLAIETKLPIYILESNNLQKLSEQEIKTYINRKKAALLKFLNAENAGILISTKPGQEKLKKALELKNKLKKKSYLFISNEINKGEFENFQINSWINTACPRLDFDSSIINFYNIKL